MPAISHTAACILDWLTIIATVSISLILSTVNPDYHHFSLLDLDISYPYRSAAKIPFALFLFLAVIAPSLIIALTCLYLPHSTQPRSARFWQLNASLLGLGVSLATSTIITTGVKNLTGKPRPDLLYRCQPDLTPAALIAHTVGGLGQPFSERWVLVDQGICRQPDSRWLNDGFRSFPSGYATVAFAGLWYLSLFLSARFGIHPQAAHTSPNPTSTPEVEPPLLLLRPSTSHPRSTVPMLTPGAPPLIFLALPYVPLGIAIFVAGTRYFDFRNHGFDVLAGAATGIVTAWFGYRLYHPPIGRRGGA